MTVLILNNHLQGDSHVQVLIHFYTRSFDIQLYFD
jgi:hypothetical protein